MPVPEFPRFKTLELSDRQSIERMTARFAPYSDYNFVSLLSWNTKNTVEWTVLRDNLAVRFDGYAAGQRPFYSLLGDNELDSAIVDLFALTKEMPVEETLQLVPEIVVDGLDQQGRYRIEEDPNNHDYVFRTSDVASCRGARFASKRKRINRFLRSYGAEARVALLDLAGAEIQRDALSVFSAWEQSRGFEREQTREELAAFEVLLRYARELDLVAVGVVVGSGLRAFSICEVRGDFAIAHFEKADVGYLGLPQYLKQAVATRLRDRGCQFVNYEQDLGLPGLRREKRSWHPWKYLRKFVISAPPEL